MRNKVTWMILSCLVAAVTVLASCTPEATPTPTAATPTPTAGTPTPTAEAHWWDKFGEPEYGGELVLRGAPDSLHTDPQCGMPGSQYVYFGESLFGPIWTIDPEEDWGYKAGFCPDEWVGNWLAESWEWKDQMTMTIKLRQGIHFQDKEPVNGRELTAEDVQYNFDKALGTGSGFTEPNPFWANQMPDIEKVVATDKYTLEVTFNTTSYMKIYSILETYVWSAFIILPPEVYESGNADDWEKAIGTGAFILTDFVSGSSLTFSRNPNYWGYDERHPENQLPYVDTLKFLGIEDMTTALAALRTGKLDMEVAPRAGITWSQAESLKKSNPELEWGNFFGPGEAIQFRCDREPFTDIRVRKALQLAIDREAIAASFYGGTVDGKPCGTANPVVYKGWVDPYEDWPQELKDEYSYNPERARELLAEAGYPGGFETNCVVSTNPEEIYEVIKGYFMEIGVDMELVMIDRAALDAYLIAGKHDQMCQGRGLTGWPIQPNIVISASYSKSVKENYHYPNDSYYDGLVEQFQTATTKEEAIAAFREADMYSLTQHWMLKTFPLETEITWQPYVKGYSGQLIIGNLWFMYLPPRFWIDQDMKASLGY